MFIAIQNVQQNNLPISQEWWWVVLALIMTTILGPFIVHSLKNGFDNAKKIYIVGNSILNIKARLNHAFNHYSNSYLLKIELFFY